MTQSKTKTCQNCNIEFIIEPEDFEFYKKIDVPEPTFCPECRMKRRINFRNEIKLYKRKCDFSDKTIISLYNPDNSLKVYDQKIWSSDKWDSMEYGQEYDFNKSFFEQFYNFSKLVPRPHNLSINSIDCDYCKLAINSKNCYLSLCSSCENCFFTTAAHSKDCFDAVWLIKGELCYECINCSNCYNLFFSQYVDNCMNSAFLYNCRNCQNCFGCVNLRHKKYYIFNKPYSKEEYEEKIKEYSLGSFNNFNKIKKEFNKFKIKFPIKFAEINKSHNVSGNNISNSKNCFNCFDISETLGCKNIFIGLFNLKDSYDIYDAGTNSELVYEGIEVGSCKNVLFSETIISSHDIQYSINCHSSSNLFACVGLRHKQYCILNKQYTKESFDKLRTKIKKHMNDMPYTDKKGRIYRYGEFFPPELSPFGYNETIANEYFPLTKEEAIKQGYNWYDKPKSEYKPTIKASNLPDNIKDVDETILKEVIACENACHSRPASVIPATGVIPAKAGIQRIQKLSGSPIKLGMTEGELGMTEGEIKMTEENTSCAGSSVFRIIPQELKFYKKMNLPLPHLCPDCRHRERIKQRNPLKLWKRKCMKKGCNTTFQTTYSPDRKEIVYCEKCYNKEVG
ncbi:MAG: hypothetical protein KKC53_06885 [Actinobacteria bacterium]|nr:hypothetical protein [Actinomycetota bacterium]